MSNIEKRFALSSETQFFKQIYVKSASQENAKKEILIKLPNE